jgi:transcriptional regulator with XRE-family HTH domain
MSIEKSQGTNTEPSLEAINLTAWAYYRNLGKRITQLRKEREMTQAELAHMLGVSQQSVFSYELGDRRVRLEFVPALTKIFGVSCDQLLGIKPTPPPPPRRRISHALERHLEIVQQLGVTDQRFILRLAESMLASRR